MSRPSGFTAAWFCLGVCATVACASPPHQDNPGADTVTGVVYHDRNGDGVRDRFDFGIRGVAVSNGVDVVRTDWRGHYRLPISDDTIVFVVKPGGYATPLGEHQLPRFHYIHKPAGSPQDLRFPGVEPTGPLPASVDFPLTRQRERDRFDVLVFGDTQPYSLAEIDLLAHDVIEELIGSDAAFGITLGDIVGDDLALFEPLSAAVARVGIPWHNVPGNHDMNYRAESDLTADETFERFYGPGTYAFEYGSAHFVVLDDVIYGGAGPEGGSSQNYSGGLSEDQLTFVGNYLSGVPRSHLVVIAMHIPLEGPTPTLDLAQRPELLALLANHPHNLSIAAHTHTQGHQFFGAESGYAGPGMHHHLIQGTTSGSWWLGATDEQGIPHAMMRDGTPNGYSILHVDGNEYAVRYKVARRPADHQMNVFLPDVIDASDPEPVEVLVNVFSGSERSSVEMRVGDSEPWSPLVRVERRAPYFVELKRREAAAGKRPERPLPPADPSTHVWQGTLRRGLPTGTHTLHVRTTDMFGQTFHANRILRVE